MTALVSAAALAGGASAGIAAAAQVRSFEFRGVAPLGSTATDQFGVPFTVTGLSGATVDATGQLWGVMDNSNKVVRIGAEFDPGGRIGSASIIGGLSVARSGDYEAIAIADGVLVLADEAASALVGFDIASGASRPLPAGWPPLPAVYALRRPNLGLESLAQHHPGPPVTWVANEEALSIDGPVSTPAGGTAVRLTRWDASRPERLAQFVYRTEPIHGPAIAGSRSGLVELVAVEGVLLAVERSLALSPAGLFQTRIYEIDVSGATDVLSNTTGLVPGTYTPVAKRLLWRGNVNNMEGLAAAPAGSDGAGRVRYRLLGVVDDADPISVNALVAFEITVEPALCRQSPDFDGSGGTPDGSDLEAFFGAWFAGDPTADFDCSGGTPDGPDILEFFNRWLACCWGP